MIKNYPTMLPNTAQVLKPPQTNTNLESAIDRMAQMLSPSAIENEIFLISGRDKTFTEFRGDLQIGQSDIVATILQRAEKVRVELRTLEPADHIEAICSLFRKIIEDQSASVPIQCTIIKMFYGSTCNLPPKYQQSFQPEIIRFFERVSAWDPLERANIRWETYLGETGLRNPVIIEAAKRDLLNVLEATQTKKANPDTVHSVLSCHLYWGARSEIRKDPEIQEKGKNYLRSRCELGHPRLILIEEARLLGLDQYFTEIDKKSSVRNILNHLQTAVDFSGKATSQERSYSLVNAFEQLTIYTWDSDGATAFSREPNRSKIEKAAQAAVLANLGRAPHNNAIWHFVPFLIDTVCSHGFANSEEYVSAVCEQLDFVRWGYKEDWERISFLLSRVSPEMRKTLHEREEVVRFVGALFENCEACLNDGGEEFFDQVSKPFVFWIKTLIPDAVISRKEFDDYLEKNAPDIIRNNAARLYEVLDRANEVAKRTLEIEREIEDLICKTPASKNLLALVEEHDASIGDKHGTDVYRDSLSDIHSQTTIDSEFIKRTSRSDLAVNFLNSATCFEFQSINGRSFISAARQILLELSDVSRIDLQPLCLEDLVSLTAPQIKEATLLLGFKDYELASIILKECQDSLPLDVSVEVVPHIYNLRIEILIMERRFGEAAEMVIESMQVATKHMQEWDAAPHRYSAYMRSAIIHFGDVKFHTGLTIKSPAGFEPDYEKAENRLRTACKLHAAWIDSNLPTATRTEKLTYLKFRMQQALCLGKLDSDLGLKAIEMMVRDHAFPELSKDQLDSDLKIKGLVTARHAITLKDVFAFYYSVPKFFLKYDWPEGAMAMISEHNKLIESLARLQRANFRPELEEFLAMHNVGILTNSAIVYEHVGDFVEALKTVKVARSLSIKWPAPIPGPESKLDKRLAYPERLYKRISKKAAAK